MNVSEIRHWPTLTFRDADRMMSWLTSIGFCEHATYRDETDSAVVLHAEWVHPAGAGVMFGSLREDALGSSGPGAAACYLVVDDADSVVDAALAAGSEVVQATTDQDYGGRSGTVRDPEGNLWSFGTYQPH